MCHFYANPLCVLLDISGDFYKLLQKRLQAEHLEAIRMLPTFLKLTEHLVKDLHLSRARGLLGNDRELLKMVSLSLEAKDEAITNVLRGIHMLASVATGSVAKIDLYTEAFKGTLTESDIVRSMLENIKRLAPEAVISFRGQISEAVEKGSLEMNLEGWAADETDFLQELAVIEMKSRSIAKEAEEDGRPVRSSYTINSKGLRTTVVAQKILLSQDKSALSKQDIEFTTLIDRLMELLRKKFVFETPRDMFLSEVWIYDATSPYRDVFTPRPRFAIERALSTPQHYLGVHGDGPPMEGLSASQPPTAILYQLYLETGSLMNVFDLWSAFYSIVGGEDGEACDERVAFALFYRALADLKLLGMVKQSKKKTDELYKLAWKGL